MPTISEVYPNRIAGVNTPSKMADANGIEYKLLPDVDGRVDLYKGSTLIGFNGLKKVSAKTASYQVLESDCGTYFIANHAATPVNFTLPVVTDCPSGMWFVFYNVGAAGMVITSNPADKLVIGNDAAADSLAFSTSNEIIGWSCEVFTDGALWYLRNNLPLEAFTGTVVT